MSTTYDTIKVIKVTLTNIQTCLQFAQEKIDFLQLESQLQQEELQQKICHLELVFVRNTETNSHHQQGTIQIIEPSTRAYLHAGVEIQPLLSKPIIRSWEELFHNMHRTGLGYDKELSFHIPN